MSVLPSAASRTFAAERGIGFGLRTPRRPWVLFAMRITLTVISGPNKGQEFSFRKHDTFLVGRSRHAHFRLPVKDRYFSRIHFMMELNPPECRLIDLNSHNGTFVNGQRILIQDLKSGDQIRAGHTTFRVAMVRDAADENAVPLSASGSYVALPEDESQLSASSELPASPDSPGLASRIGGYHLIQELGEGSMGKTFLGRRQQDSKLFAVKIVCPMPGGTVGQAQQFLGEVKALQAIRHPNVVRLRAAAEENGVIYFVSEYVKGSDAAGLMGEGRPLDVDQVLDMTDQIVAALTFTHEKKLVHRDIKPSNVVVAEDGGKVKLADFGLSYLFGNSQLSGLTVIQPGSASFMPPEYLTSFHAAHAAGDQYSLAATMYYLLTAQPPIETNMDLSGQFSALLDHKTQPILERRPTLPESLAAAIDRALSSAPAKRFASVGEFREALRGS